MQAIVRSSKLAALAVIAAVAAAACNKPAEVSAEPEPIARLDAGPEAEVDSPDVEQSDAPKTWSCPERLPGAKLVLVPWPDGGAYCIDQREVTYAEYKAFLEAKGGNTIRQPEECAWNTSFTPALVFDPHDDEGDCYADQWKIDSEPSFPVNCVDFCDAWAYCAWAGKRLCGMRGADGTKILKSTYEALETTTVSTQSEWYFACSQGGTSKFPYGDTFEEARCIDTKKVQEEGSTARAVEDVTASECRGQVPPYDQIYDLSGSAAAWQNAGVFVEGSGFGQCLSQGGGRMQHLPERLGCGSPTLAYGKSQWPDSGIRCCADAVAGPG
jgi:formylglycine-generating enzyme